MSFKLPVATDWDQQDEEKRDRLLGELDRMLVRSDGTMSSTGALVFETLAEVCNPLLMSYDWISVTMRP